MKIQKLLVIMLLLAVSVLTVSVSTVSVSFAKGAKKIPTAKVKTLKGKTLNTAKFHNDGKPFIINFWATWCKPCIKELNAIDEVYQDWVDETGVKIYAISIDDSRNSRRVAPFIKGRQWQYEVLLDENKDFFRAMNVSNPPHTFLYNGKGELVWEHNGYAPGGEDEIYEQLLKLKK